MALIPLCKSISTTFSHNQRLAVSDEQRVEFAAVALEQVRTGVFPELELISGAELEAAREAVLSTLTPICIEFARKCCDYRWAVERLEEVAAACSDPVVRKKLAVCANQLKSRWNQAEPGGIHHAPRASKAPAKASPAQSFSLLAVVLIFAAAGYLLLHLDLAQLVFPGYNKAPSAEPAVATSSPEPDEPPAPVLPAPPAPADAPAPVSAAAPAAGDFCTYTDEQGTVHMVNDPAQVPPKYRQRMKVLKGMAPAPSATPVLARKNQVLVPVRITWRGKSVDTTLLLDTGATITTISADVAGALGVPPSETRTGTARVADGRSVASFLFTADAVSVGPRTVTHTPVSILPGVGGGGARRPARHELPERTPPPHRLRARRHRVAELIAAAK